MSKPIVVAVDGPAGSGKSSICRDAARRMNWLYVNTGAVYRSLAVVARQLEIDLADEDSMGQLCEDFGRHLRWECESDRMFYKDQDITDLLTSAQAGPDASAVAKMSSVRRLLLSVQREMALAADRGVLVDGRDIGTVVFPDAQLKIFMTASLDKRARRRLDQLAARPNGHAELPTLDELKTEIARRDFQDQNRGLAPLKAAEDAKVVDTSESSFEQCVDLVVQMIHETELKTSMAKL